MVAFDAKCDLGAFGMVMDYREHVTSNVVQENSNKSRAIYTIITYINESYFF